MPKITTSQHSFNSGTLSSNLFGRTDVARYFSSVEQATNVLIQPQGPLRRRNGFRYVADAVANDETIRLIPFQVTGGIDNLILEFSDLLITPFEYDSNGDPAKVAATTIVTPYADSELADLQFVQFNTRLYLFHPDHEIRILIRTNDTTWTLNTLNAAPPPLFEAGFNPSETLTLGATSGLGVTATAGAASFIEADVGRQIIEIGGTGIASITGFTSTTVVTVDITTTFSTTSIADEAWFMDLSPNESVTPSGQAKGSIITLTAAPDDTWRASDVGRYVVINDGIVLLTEFTTALIVKGLVKKSLSSVTASEVWSLEDPTWSSTRGFPRSGALYQGRLFVGGTAALPTTVWASATNVFDDFSRGVEDDDSFSIDASIDYSDDIQWISGGRDLIVGTVDGEISISGAGFISPTNNVQQTRTSFGSPHIQAIRLGNETLFINANSRQVRALSFVFEQSNYEGQELTFFIRDLIDSDIVEIAVTKDPDPVVWLLKANGNLVAITYSKSEQVLGATDVITDGTVESISSIRFQDRDNLWAVINRTINGSAVKYIETVFHGDNDKDLSSFQDSYTVLSNPTAITGATQANPVVITATGHGLSDGDTVRIKDVIGMVELNRNVYTVTNKTATTFELFNSSGASIDGTGFTAYVSGGNVHEMVTTVSGLSHLEGETVQVRGDGAVLPPEVVTSGAITLDTPAGEVVVGMAYTSTIKTLSHTQRGLPQGVQGQPKRFIEPILRVHKSAHPNVNGQVKPIRIPSDPMTGSVGLTTGDLIYGTLSFSSEAQLTITQGLPVPLELQALFGIIEINTR